MIATKSGGVWSDQLTYLYTTLPRRHHVFSKQNSSSEQRWKPKVGRAYITYVFRQCPLSTDLKSTNFS